MEWMMSDRNCDAVHSMSVKYRYKFSAYTILVTVHCYCYWRNCSARIVCALCVCLKWMRSCVKIAWNSKLLWKIGLPRDPVQSQIHHILRQFLNFFAHSAHRTHDISSDRLIRLWFERMKVPNASETNCTLV